VVYFPSEEEIRPIHFSTILRQDLNNVIGYEFREEYGSITLISASIHLESFEISLPPPFVIQSPPNAPSEGAVMDYSETKLEQDESHINSTEATVLIVFIVLGFATICFALRLWCLKHSSQVHVVHSTWTGTQGTTCANPTASLQLLPSRYPQYVQEDMATDSRQSISQCQHSI